MSAFRRPKFTLRGSTNSNNTPTTPTTPNTTTTTVIGGLVLFRGKDDECDSFVRMIRQRAFEEDKLDDPRWMAGLASTFFADRALKWHAHLPAETQTNWTLLERALLKRFGAVNDDGNSTLNDDRSVSPFSVLSANLVPTPAAAAPIPAAVPSPADLPMPAPAPAPIPAPTPTIADTMSTLSISSPKQVGRIKVVSDALPGGADGYICSSISDHGHFWATMDECRALIVYFMSDSNTIQPLNTTGKGLIGLQWKKNNVILGPGSSEWAKFIMVTRSPGSLTQVSSSDNARGEMREAVWNVSPSDGTLYAKWIDGTATEHVLGVTVDAKKAVYFTPDVNAYVAKHPLDKAGRLVFEPL